MTLVHGRPNRIVIALRDREFPVQYIHASAEGHVFFRPINNMAFIAAMEKFLQHILEEDTKRIFPKG